MATILASELLGKGIHEKEVFAVTLLERGKLSPTVAYELRVGRGLYYRPQNYWPLLYKVNIVYYDLNDNEIKRDIGCSTIKEETARRFISKERERFIRLHNNKLRKEQGIKQKRRTKAEMKEMKEIQGEG